MTRTKTIATLWCTALAATLAAYGCGSSSTIDTGTGGSPGAAGGHTGGGQGGNGVVIINTGGMTGSGGMTGGGMGGMVTPPRDAGPPPPPVDAGPPVCAAGNRCTAGFTCSTMCRAGGQMGTTDCTCNNNGRIACGACMVPDAGAPPPPVDAGPRPDAGPVCGNNVRNNVACTVGMSLSPCVRNAGGGGTQTCTCALVPPTDAGTPADAGGPPPPAARYTCM